MVLESKEAIYISGHDGNVNNGNHNLPSFYGDYYFPGWLHGLRKSHTKSLFAITFLLAILAIGVLSILYLLIIPQYKLNAKYSYLLEEVQELKLELQLQHASLMKRDSSIKTINDIVTKKNKLIPNSNNVFSAITANKSFDSVVVEDSTLVTLDDEPVDASLYDETNEIVDEKNGTAASYTLRRKRSKRAAENPATGYYSANEVARRNGQGILASVGGGGNAACQCEPGPEGNPGVKGDQGEPGFPGPRGEIGETGEPGKEGPPGPTGPAGEKGEVGMKGMTGDAGEPGTPGNDGAPGNPGEPGPQGPPGRDGEPGVDGKNGEPGKQGEPGKDGQDGEPGLDGRPGKDGYPGEPGKDGKDGAPGPVGEKGMTGVQGPPGPEGQPGPPGKDGAPGLPGPVTETLVKAEPGQDGLPGEPGTPGRDGTPGAQGEPGVSGPPGPPGIQGAPGRDGLEGPRGEAGKDGNPGRDGAQGPPGEKGQPGEKGEPGLDGICPDCSEAKKELRTEIDTMMTGMKGMVYTRWGSLTCNIDEEQLYFGHTASGHFHYTGSGANYLCMPDQPKFADYKDGIDGNSLIFGARYFIFQTQTAWKKELEEIHNKNAACSVCYVPNKTMNLMIPALSMCPNGFSEIYRGYIMSTRERYARTEYICVHEKQDIYPRGLNTTVATGSLLLFVESHCGSLSCDIYADGREINCIVCGR